MARPREIEEIDCDQSFALAAAKVVEIRAAEVFGHSQGVLDLDDVERLHDMRVATRRLRAALEVFRPCFPRKICRRARKLLKALADALGERRDRDVAIEFLQGFLGDVPAGDSARLEILIARLRDEQRQANEDLAPYLAEDRLTELGDVLDELVGGGAQMKARKVKGLKPDEPLRTNAARVVATRLDELRGFAEEALEPSGEAAQHEMRIAAKRLRYVLEITATCLGPEAETARRIAKELQGVLGDIHDCDVMTPKVEGIEAVEALLRTRRELLHARFRELWLAPETQSALGGLEGRAAA